jgi:hypothetical protein
MKKASLSTFFIIKHKGQGDTGIIWPAGMRRGLTIANKVPRIDAIHKQVP